jgi:hypothetical protein
MYTISWYLYHVNVNSDIIVKRLIKMADKLLVSSYDEEIFNFRLGRRNFFP